MKNELIAFSPLILFFLGSSIYLWIKFGWKAGIEIPIIFLISTIITLWITYWMNKDIDLEEEE